METCKTTSANSCALYLYSRVLFFGFYMIFLFFEGNKFEINQSSYSSGFLVMIIDFSRYVFLIMVQDYYGFCGSTN